MSSSRPARAGAAFAVRGLALLCAGILLGASSRGAQQEGISWGPLRHELPWHDGRWRAEREVAAGRTRLLLGDGGLRRLRAGKEVALPVTTVRGTGEVHDLARDPAGLELVAAEHGVFVLSRDVEALDPLEPMPPLELDGVRSIHVDAERRLWFAGDGVFGVLEMAGQWGYRFAPEDLPPELRDCDTLRVGPAPQLGLLVEGRRGDERVTRRYVPDRGASPRVVELRVNGEPWDWESAIEVTYPDGFRLEARGEALGGARFRFRVDEHHVWRDLGEEPVIERFSPGEHTLDVIAVDRDLARSAPVRLKIHSAFPPRFDKRFVVVALAVFGVLAVGLFLLYEKRQGWRPGALYRAPLSAGLLVILTLQVLAGIEPHGKGWPFMGFSMYTTRFDQGDVIFESVLVGLQKNGGTRVIPPQAVGVAIDGRWQVLGPLVDRGEEVARQYLETYNAKHAGSEVLGLQVRARRHRLTPDGAIEVAPQILSHYRAPRTKSAGTNEGGRRGDG